jgi:hypothetical protein
MQSTALSVIGRVIDFRYSQNGSIESWLHFTNATIESKCQFNTHFSRLHRKRRQQIRMIQQKTFNLSLLTTSLKEKMPSADARSGRFHVDPWENLSRTGDS